MVEVSSLSLAVTHREKDKRGWCLMTQKDRERKSLTLLHRPIIRPPKNKKSACGLLLIAAEENKVHFQKGLVSMTQLFQRT